MAKNKIPVSKRSPKEQILYWSKLALGWLKVGAPCAANKSLRKALLVANGNNFPEFAVKLALIRGLAGGSSPRAADHPLENFISHLSGK